MSGLAAVAPLGIELVDGHEFPSPPTAGGAIVVAAVGPVMQERGAEKRAKSAPALVEARQRAALEQVGEEALDKVVGFVRRMSLVAAKGVEREPIVAAEIRERFAGARRIDVASGENATPVSGGELRDEGFSAMTGLILYPENDRPRVSPRLPPNAINVHHGAVTSNPLPVGDAG